MKGEPSKKILFVMYSAFGDVVRAIPLARRIRDHFPDHSLTWLVAVPNDELVRALPYADDLLVWDRSRDNGAYFELLLRVRKGRFSRLIAPQATDRIAFLSLLSGIPWRTGNRRRPFPAFNVSWQTFLDGLGTVPDVEGFSFKEPFLSRSRAKRASLRDPFIAAAIGASKVQKQWPLENWMAFGRLAVEAGWGLCLLGDGKEEEEKAASIAGSLPSERVLNLVGRCSLTESVAIVQQSRLLVAGDTGLLHVAYVSGVPAVGLFGPTLPEQVGLGAIRAALLADCPDRGCFRWDCPRQDCLRSISARSVFETAASLVPLTDRGLS